MFSIPENIATIYYKISLCVFQYQYYFGRNKISSGGDLSHYSSASLY